MARNAASFNAQGYSIVLDEDELTIKELVENVKDLYENRQSYIDTMNQSPQSDAIPAVMELIKEYSK